MRHRGRGVAVLASATVVTVALLTSVTAGVAGATEPDQRAATTTTAERAVTALAPVLLSRNEPTVVSSSGGCCAPPNAVDGNAATRWASETGTDPSWIRVDLGATANLTRVRLQWTPPAPARTGWRRRRTARPGRRST